MGTASSRFGETDWDKVDGGLTDASSTIDGRDPTAYHSILTLKKSNLVNQRSFEIRDDANELLYTSQPIEGTTKWFDLCDATGHKRFCVQTTDSSRSVWNVYSYLPVWEGQVADDKADDSPSITSPLYRKARIDITWNKSHGQVHLMEPRATAADDASVAKGTAAAEPMLKVEEIKSITGQYQSFVPRYDLVDNALHPPLVGWWVWEHSRNKHEIKMHLAKGTDIALHCLLAILTNMVHVEKHSGV